MSDDKRSFPTPGTLQVNGQLATQIDYDLQLAAGRVQTVQLRFRNGRSVVAHAQLSLEQARELIGAANFAVLSRALDKAQAPGRDPPGNRVRGELSGPELAYREVILPEPAMTTGDNTIQRTDPAREPAATVAPTSAPGAGTASRDDSDQTGTPQGASAQVQAEPPHPALHQRGLVPDSVARRFLSQDNRYYFPGGTLAFRDDGHALTAVSNNLEVIRGLIAIAKARGWRALAVYGNEEFRRAIWREATLRGIAVAGYHAGPLEQAAVEHTREPQREAQADAVAPNPSVHNVAGVAKNVHRTAAAAPANGAPNTAQPSSRASQEPPLRLTGTLLDAGRAPYQFAVDANTSYYVKLATDAGDRYLWGVDLERALAQSQSGVKPGDDITVQRWGAQPATVRAPVRDHLGKIIGEQPLHTHRNRWRVELTAHLAQLAGKAAAVRAGVLDKTALATRFPELTNVIASLQLGELFAQKLLTHATDRQRFVDTLREMLANAVQRGESIPAPIIKAGALHNMGAAADTRGDPRKPRARDNSQPDRYSPINANQTREPMRA